MQVADRIEGAAALGRHDLHQIADGRRIDRPQKRKLTFRNHGVSLFAFIYSHATATIIEITTSMATIMATQPPQPAKVQAMPPRKAPALPPI